MFPRALSSLRWLRPLLLAAAVSGTWSSAQAAVYHGVWDPPYGFPFGNATSGLGWRGTADYFVPNTCELSGTGQVDNYGTIPGIPGNCGGMAVVNNAEVELYNVASPGQPTLATLNFDASSLHVLSLNYVGGQLAGLSTTFSDFINPPENLTSVNVPDWASFSLAFRYSGPRLAWGICSGSDFTASESLSYYETEHCVILGLNANYGDYRPDFRITRVPEPASLGLVGVALAAGAGVGIRRRRKAAQ